MMTNLVTSLFFWAGVAFTLSLVGVIYHEHQWHQRKVQEWESIDVDNNE